MKKPKIPSTLVQTALVSAGLTIIFSLLYLALCVVALVYRFNCDAGEVVNGANYIWNNLYEVYIVDGECRDGQLVQEQDVTDSYRVFIFVIITLCASIVTLSLAITLITTILKEAHDIICPVVYGYVVVCILSLIIDIIFAVHFGNDYAKFQNELEMLPVDNTNYEKDIHRIGALILMTLALKGYIAHAFNIVLVTMLLVQAARFQNIPTSSNHSIHKLGALRAYDSQLRPDGRERRSGTFDISSVNIYPTFIDDEPPRSLKREPSRLAAPNLAFDRSNSWQHNSQPVQGASRPFSYLEMKSAPKVEPALDSWRRDWPPGPPLPAPDYSPLQGRRLKSALKHDF